MNIPQILGLLPKSSPPMGDQPRHPFWSCRDCGENTFQEYFMIHSHLWKKITSNSRDILCIGCCEAKLGRELCPEDFTDCKINKSWTHRKSQRLLSRLGLQR